MSERENINRNGSIRVDRNGLCLSMSREDEHRLGGRICVPKRRSFSDHNQGYDVREELEPLISEERCANYGILPLLMLLSLRRGIPFVMNRLTENDLVEEIDYPELQFIEALRFIGKNENGLIRVGKEVNVAALIAFVITCYSERRIIVVGRGKLLRSAYEGVRQYFSDNAWFQRNVVFVDDRHPFDRDREYPLVAFSPPIAAADIGSEHCEIAILLDAFDCLFARVEDFLCQTDARFRLFGIQQVKRRPTPYEKARLYRAFGFEQIELESRDRVRREVTYDFVPLRGACPIGAVIPRTQQTSGRKGDLIDPRRAYVYHNRRNCRIVRIARGLLDAEEPIVVMVDQLDHAVQLAHKLPELPIFARPESDLSGVRGKMRQRLNPPVPTRRKGLKAIVVADAAQRFPGYFARGIIWAGGGYSVRIPRPWMFEFRRRRYPLTIVDFQDRFSPELFAASRSRLESMERMDIFPFRKTAPESSRRMERFIRTLKQRPLAVEGEQ